ncbi:NAD(P)H-hydrate epimerase [Microbacterium sp. No. 7]|uniref:NAD(P)H-hydrate epimerase n=1 Tax=Microbacterium sp. No. 7 TaxID=1714373 RepID=UPI0006D05874|nr:NAD(P)H-hydrate epimerase [Microbacterium sp. No. 7]ALJ19594.1 hypothetical protein AOA12_06590 [Microbacterium sp. No. 7]
MPAHRTTVPTYTAAHVRAAEAPLLAAGVPLMARAAAALARIVAGTLSAGGRVLVLAGSGDNGGDALFAAADLTTRAAVDVLAVSGRWHEGGMRAAEAAGARRVDLATAAATSYDIVLDGILGIGALPDPRLRGAAREAVEALLPAVRAGRTRVVAVDVPSGLHPDTGAADDAVLPAATTVTFGAVKHGLASGEGPRLAGGIVLVRIGLDDALAAVTPAGEAVVADVVDAA